MNSKNNIQQWIYLPLLLCSTTAIAAGQQVSSQQQAGEAQQVNSANYEYVGGKTRIGVGVDTEFSGTADINHVFSESKDNATSGDAWVGFDITGKDKGIKAGGGRLNHHWVERDGHGNAKRVSKAFGAYDRNSEGDDKVTVGYGQETDIGFIEGYVGKGLSDKRKTGETAGKYGQYGKKDIFTKVFNHNVGGQVGTFLPDSNVRVRGGVDYAWDKMHAQNENKPEKLTVSAGVEKFFKGTPHSVALNVATSRSEGGYAKKSTDTRGNLSYRYDFAGAGAFQNGTQLRRVRVEMPNHSQAASQQATTRTVAKSTTPVARRTPPKRVKVAYKKAYKQAYKKPYKKAYKQAYKKSARVKTCKLIKSTVELGSDTFFKNNSANLLGSARGRLDNVISQIRRTGYHGNIRVTGNTCNLGDAKMNQSLSERRAGAVKRYLSSHGFKANEIIIRGLGEAAPKYANTTANRHRNRRVDIEYMKQDTSCTMAYKTVHKTAYRTAYKTEYKTAYRTAYKTAYRMETKKQAPVRNVVVKQAGISKPSVTWRTERVSTQPAWVTRALHNTIQHSRHIDTFETTAGAEEMMMQSISAQNDTVESSGPIQQMIDVLDNDKGSSLKISSVSQGSHGTVSILRTAGRPDLISYTQSGHITENDHFTYTVTDSYGYSKSTATVTVTPMSMAPATTTPAPKTPDTTPAPTTPAPTTPNTTPAPTTPTNRAPAVESVYQAGTVHNDSSGIEILPMVSGAGINGVGTPATDPDGDILTIEALSSSHGSVSLDPTRTRILFIANTGHLGFVRIDYTVSDGKTESSGKIKFTLVN
ncbi:MAG: OmpA family protein [Thiotrichaceae bacterium]|nr:OmpA family protein [Thiotrichaceae bacterium]